MRDSDRTFPEAEHAALEAPAQDASASGADDPSGPRKERVGIVADVIQRLAGPKGALLPSNSPNNSLKNSQFDADMTDIDALCDALVSSNVDAIAALIRQIEARGVSPDACYLDYIGAAARRMGERWVDDCATFMEVTLAGGRLVSMLRELAFSFGGPEITPLPGHTILISNVPGEAHHLGAAIAAEYFRRARWRVVLLDGADRQEIRACLAAEKFAVVGVSAGSRRMVPTLAETVRDVRRICPDAVVCVGGHILALEPEIVRTTGADHAGADPAMLAVLLRRHIPLPTLGPEFHHVEV